MSELGTAFQAFRDALMALITPVLAPVLDWLISLTTPEGNDHE